jgi:hypothetical protein
MLCPSTLANTLSCNCTAAIMRNQKQNVPSSLIISFFGGRGGPGMEWHSLIGAWDIIWPIVPAAVGRWRVWSSWLNKNGKGNRRITGRKLVPVPLCSQQVPHDLILARTRAAAVESRRLTDWTIARPSTIPTSATVHHLEPVPPTCEYLYFIFVHSRCYREFSTPNICKQSFSPADMTSPMFSADRPYSLSCFPSCNPFYYLPFSLLFPTFTTDFIQWQKSSVAWVRERTIPTVRPPLVGKVIANLCYVVSVTDPHARILGFFDRSRYFFFQVAPQLYSRDWVDPIPDPLLLRKSYSAGNRTRISGSVTRNSDH